MKNYLKILILLISVILLWVVYDLYYELIWEFVIFNCSVWFWFTAPTYDSWFLQFINQYKVWDLTWCSSTYENIMVSPEVTMIFFLLFAWCILFFLIDGLFNLKWKYKKYFIYGVIIFVFLLVINIGQVPLWFDSDFYDNI